MRFLRPTLAVAAIATLLFASLSVRQAESLPLFARKFGVQCTTCHLAFPRLNAFGIAFRQNGYRMPGTKGHSPWEDKEVPLSVIGNVGMQYTHQTQPDSSAFVFVQNAVEFHSAGTLAENISFHFDNNFAGVNLPLYSGVAYVIFDDVIADGKLNVKTGIFDSDLPYLADSRKTTLSGYLAPVTLAGQGIELNGTSSGWTYAVGVNTSARTMGQPGKTFVTLETPYAWFVRDFSGQLVGGRVVMDRQDARAAGKTGAAHTQVDLSTYLNRPRWALIPGVTFEKFGDADPALADPASPANGARDQMTTGLLEGLLFLDKDSKWLLTGRYELRQMPAFKTLQSENDQQVVGNISFYANPNCLVGVEYSRISNNIGGQVADGATAFVHVGY